LKIALTDLKNSLAESKFGVLWELDIVAKMKEKGIDYPGQIVVLEVCNPRRAKSVLEIDIKAGSCPPRSQFM